MSEMVISVKSPDVTAMSLKVQGRDQQDKDAGTDTCSSCRSAGCRRPSAVIVTLSYSMMIVLFADDPSHRLSESLLGYCVG